MTFHELHVEPLLEHTDAVWVAPVPTRWCDIDPEARERADPVDVVAEGCRHSFGLLNNPPQRVWEAQRRLVLGDVHRSEDQELVDAFAAENAYYGHGIGKHENSIPRGFKVRRPGYSPSLAKRRRIQKGLRLL